MSEAISIRLGDLNAEVLAKWRKQYGQGAIIELKIEEGENAALAAASNDLFWKVIDAIDWEAKGSEAQLEPAIAFLASKEIVDIYLFADKLSELLVNLNTPSHQKAYQEKEHTFSADDFLYVRAAAVAEGKTYYEKVLRMPAELSVDIVYEPLLYLADAAFQTKTGQPFNYKPRFDYETNPYSTS